MSGPRGLASRDPVRQAFSLEPLPNDDEPRPLAWAGMKQAFGLAPDQRLG